MKYCKTLIIYQNVNSIEHAFYLLVSLLQHCPPLTQVPGDFLKPYSTSEQAVSPPAPQPQLIITPSSKSVLPLIKVSRSTTDQEHEM